MLGVLSLQLLLMLSLPLSPFGGPLRVHPSAVSTMAPAAPRVWPSRDSAALCARTGVGRTPLTHSFEPGSSQSTASTRTGALLQRKGKARLTLDCLRLLNLGVSVRPRTPRFSSPIPNQGKDTSTKSCSVESMHRPAAQGRGLPTLPGLLEEGGEG